jgi:steroid delta-isomerase-like uncharacterized protein
MGGAEAERRKVVGGAKDVVLRFYKLFEAGDLDGADELFGDDCITVTPAGEMTKKEHRAFGEAFKAALPDAHMVVSTAMEDDGVVAVEGRFRGTHTGDLVTAQGTIPPNGHTIDLGFADFFTVNHGKIVEQRTYWDQGDMMRQLGAGPPG